jgi:hypothetical protein
MDNLLAQKKKLNKLKKEMAELQENQETEQRQLEEDQKKLEQKKLKEINEDFNTRQQIRQMNEKLNKKVEQDEIDQIQEKKMKDIEAYTNKEVFDYNDRGMKIQKKAISFWLNDSKINSGETKLQATKLFMTCPGDDKHQIKLKHLIKVHPVPQKDIFLCKYCEKHLNYQKVVCIDKCGHVFCGSCISHFDKKCVCGKSFKAKNVVKMRESGSGYAQHNNTEVKLYTRAYVG